MHHFWLLGQKVRIFLLSSSVSNKKLKTSQSLDSETDKNLRSKSIFLLICFMRRKKVLRMAGPKKFPKEGAILFDDILLGECHRV